MIYWMVIIIIISVDLYIILSLVLHVVQQMYVEGVGLMTAGYIGACILFTGMSGVKHVTTGMLFGVRRCCFYC